MEARTHRAGVVCCLLLAALVLGCGSEGGGGEGDTSDDPSTDEAADTSTDQPADTPEEIPDDTAEEPPGDTAGDPSSDPPGDSMEDTPDDTAGDERDADEETTACLPAATPSGDEGHRPGHDCLSCHDGTGGRPRWTIAGTLYTDASGTSPVGNATIVVRQSDGTELLLVTHANGNFYTSTAVAFPVTVAASKCPDHVGMSSSVSNGSCNSCHGASSRIHLP